MPRPRNVRISDFCGFRHNVVDAQQFDFPGCEQRLRENCRRSSPFFGNENGKLTRRPLALDRCENKLHEFFERPNVGAAQFIDRTCARLAVGDVAAAIADAVDGKARAGTVYELGGPDIRTFKELMQFVLATIERKRLLVSLPFSVAKLQAMLLQYLPKPLLTPIRSNCCASTTLCRKPQNQRCERFRASASNLSRLKRSSRLISGASVRPASSAIASLNLYRTYKARSPAPPTRIRHHANSAKL